MESLLTKFWKEKKLLKRMITTTNITIYIHFKISSLRFTFFLCMTNNNHYVMENYENLVYIFDCEYLPILNPHKKKKRFFIIK